MLQQKKPSRSSANIPNINARLEYTALPQLDPDLPQPELTADNLHLAGNIKRHEKYVTKNIKKNPETKLGRKERVKYIFFGVRYYRIKYFQCRETLVTERTKQVNLIKVSSDECAL